VCEDFGVGERGVCMRRRQSLSFRQLFGSDIEGLLRSEWWGAA
jgi:hypothetical protein